MRYIEFFTLVAIDNPLFYDFNNNGKIFFKFIINHTIELASKSIITISNIREVLNKLIEIGFNKANTLALIKEIAAIESLYEILYVLFKSSLNCTELIPCMLRPLELASRSLANYRLLSLNVSEQLISISKRVDEESRIKLYEYIGDIGAVNTTPRLMLKLLKNIPKRREIVDALISAILGQIVTEVFYFTGGDKSFIKLKCDPSYKIEGEFCYVGRVRIESGVINKKMCIWSLLHISHNEFRGVELHCIDRKPVIYIIKKNTIEIDGTIKIKSAEFKENIWHSIIISISQRKLKAYFDDSFVEREFTRHMLPKMYNNITIGASFQIEKFTSHFIGEMSSMYFFSHTEKFEECMKEIAVNILDIDKIFINKHILKDNKDVYDVPLLKTRSFYNLDIMNSVIHKINPHVL